MKAVEITLDIEQPIYEVTTLLNAASLIIGFPSRAETLRDFAPRRPTFRARPAGWVVPEPRRHHPKEKLVKLPNIATSEFLMLAGRQFNFCHTNGGTTGSIEGPGQGSEPPWKHERKGCQSEACR